MSPPASGASGCIRRWLEVGLPATTSCEATSKLLRDCSSVQEVLPGDSFCRWKAEGLPFSVWQRKQRAWPGRFFRKMGSTLVLKNSKLRECPAVGGETSCAAGCEVLIIAGTPRAANKIVLIAKRFFTVSSMPCPGQINFRLPNQLQ